MKKIKIVRDTCNRIIVPKECCYISFEANFRKRTRGFYCDSVDKYDTIRDEQMIMDRDKKGRIIGIELLSSKKAKKPCQK